MGAWGHQSFENDDAADWVDDLVESSAFLPINKSIDRIVKSENALEAPECSMAIAAAEVVAALAGKASPNLPNRLKEWIATRDALPGHMIVKSREAVESVLADSELRELWVDSDDYKNWRRAIEDLIGRLSCN